MTEFTHKGEITIGMDEKRASYFRIIHKKIIVIIRREHTLYKALVP